MPPTAQQETQPGSESTSPTRPRSHKKALSLQVTCPIDGKPFKNNTGLSSYMRNRYGIGLAEWNQQFNALSTKAQRDEMIARYKNMPAKTALAAVPVGGFVGTADRVISDVDALSNDELTTWIKVAESRLGIAHAVQAFRNTQAQQTAGGKARAASA